MISYTVYAMNSTEKQKPTIYEWWPLLTDPEKEKPEVYTIEERAEILETAQQRLAMFGK